MTTAREKVSPNSAPETGGSTTQREKDLVT